MFIVMYRVLYLFFNINFKFILSIIISNVVILNNLGILLLFKF